MRQTVAITCLRTLSGLQDLYWRFLERHLKEPFERAVLETTLILMGLAALEALLVPPPAFRLLYVAPIWLASRAQGLKAGTAIVALTTLVVTILDVQHGGMSGLAGIANLFLYGVLLLVLMLHITRVEHGIQAYARMASIDPLTGIYNRLALQEAAEKEIEQALRNSQPLVVAVIDCDKFKELNDELGHAFGDSVLITLARMLRKHVRSSGIVARTGGDEFVAVLPGRHLDDAGTLIERIGEAFSEQTRGYGREARISYGLARLNIHGKDLSSLVSAADKSMYYAKHARVPDGTEVMVQAS
jgi:diguanylate cyclase (GGDEF)-like protein